MLHFCYMWESSCRLYREVLLFFFSSQVYEDGQKFTEKYGQTQRIAVVLILSAMQIVGVDGSVLKVTLAWESGGVSLYKNL